ncbi:MAG: right-handed parallel beta-helix repeat-containing protein [Eubacteriales bacterium]
MTEFKVTDYGAVPDGVTDSTAAFESALADAEKCHGTVLVPSGDYIVGKLRMGEGVALRGVSGWSFRDNGTATLHLRDSGCDCMIDMTGSFGGSISGLCLDGRGFGENIHGVKVYWEKYNGGAKEDTPTFDDCRVGHFSGDGIHLEHIWCFSIRHCMLCFNGGCGLYIDGWDAFILDNWFSGNRNCGILGGPCVASITATGNRVEWNSGAGFRFLHGDSYNITGNFFDRSGGPAISMGDETGGCSTVTITGNIFRRSGKPCDKLTDELDNCHLRMTKCENVVVTGNAFRLGRDDGGVGVDSPVHSVVMRENSYTILRDNVMHHGQLGDALVLDGNTDCVIDGNNG